MSAVNIQQSQQAVEVTVAIESASLSRTELYYVPGTLKVKLGFGEHVVNVLTAGGGNTSTYRASNEKTKKSYVALEVINNLQYQNIFATLKNDLENFEGAATIFYEDITTGLENVFPNMAITNDAEFVSSEDGTVTFEFEGSPALVT